MRCETGYVHVPVQSAGDAVCRWQARQPPHRLCANLRPLRLSSSTASTVGGSQVARSNLPRSVCSSAPHWSQRARPEERDRRAAITAYASPRRSVIGSRCPSHRCAAFFSSCGPANGIARSPPRSLNSPSGMLTGSTTSRWMRPSVSIIASTSDSTSSGRQFVISRVVTSPAPVVNNPLALSPSA